jgi:hypothetical protein
MLVERIKINNYSKEVGEKILRAWGSYKELFGLETDVIKKLKDEGKSAVEITASLEARRNDIKTLWPDLKKTA